MAGNSRSALVATLVVAAVAILWYRSTVYDTPTTIERPKLIVLTGGNGPYWQLMAEGARAAAEEHNAELELLMPEGNDEFEKQNVMLMALKGDQADGIALSPLDANRQTRMINALADETIVVTIDSDAPQSERCCYVGASNHAAGVKVAKQMQEVLPEGGKVVVCLANLTKDNMIERKLGIEDHLSDTASEGDADAPTFEIVQWLVDDGDRERCRTQLVDFLKANDDIVCIVGLNAFHGGEMVAAVEELGLSDTMKIIAFDTEDVTLDALANGKIHATIAQDPYQYGYASVRHLADLCRKDEHGRAPAGLPSTHTVDTRVLHQADVDEYRQKFLKEPKAEKD
ncbi:substrate-binding domain-containing protein [Aeoliella sp. SH292]|uniref:substrate-binding domain-containing protein n=1 Tax=Aeoliella sp. SH292 TaxID=3454464 RepID=UPI003F9B5A9C